MIIKGIGGVRKKEKRGVHQAQGIRRRGSQQEEKKNCTRDRDSLLPFQKLVEGTKLFKSNTSELRTGSFPNVLQTAHVLLLTVPRRQRVRMQQGKSLAKGTQGQTKKEKLASKLSVKS